MWLIALIVGVMYSTDPSMPKVLCFTLICLFTQRTDTHPVSILACARLPMFYMYLYPSLQIISYEQFVPCNLCPTLWYFQKLECKFTFFCICMDLIQLVSHCSVPELDEVWGGGEGEGGGLRIALKSYTFCDSLHSSTVHQVETQPNWVSRCVRVRLMHFVELLGLWLCSLIRRRSLECKSKTDERNSMKKWLDANVKLRDSNISPGVAWRELSHAICLHYDLKVLGMSLSLGFRTSKKNTNSKSRVKNWCLLCWKQWWLGVYLSIYYL